MKGVNAPAALSGSEFNFNDMPNNYSVMKDAQGKPTGIALNGKQVASIDENGGIQFKDQASKDAYDKAMADKKAAAKAECEKRGGYIADDGQCHCSEGTTFDGQVCVENEQTGGWMDWLGKNWLALAGAALGVAGIILALRKNKKGKSGKDGEDGADAEPADPITTEDLASGGNYGSGYGSIVPSASGSRGSSGGGSGGGTGSGGGGSGSGEEDEKSAAATAAAQRAAAGDGAIAAYTYAKKNLDAADAFPAKAEAITEQIEDAQTWRDAFQAVIDADYAAYTESARFLTVLATEGEQKSTDIIGSGALPRIQEVYQEGEE